MLETRSGALTCKNTAHDNVMAQEVVMYWTPQRSISLFLPPCRFTRYDYVEIEDLTEKTILGRWCGSQSVLAGHTSKGNQIRIRFVSDEYFPSEPGFCIHYSLLPSVRTSSKARTSKKFVFFVSFLKDPFLDLYLSSASHC